MVKNIMNFKEASEYLGLSRSMLYKLTSTNKITYSKPGGKLLYFEVEELDKWMLGNKHLSVIDELGIVGLSKFEKYEKF
ncbi:MAG: helix-turn-helix domain-containing protein [Saprospiraceae bacterium]|nr:helix-turn-helix domain-containing protein [Saprospiraceae bacterium]